ncbi:MAG TPA: amino acid adenylation domain-containing protein [Thermoanaerobaculia bacterium]|nr:amino acid adenylation domain-containing protein [Thermoanaerobaculia bacterium]
MKNVEDLYPLSPLQQGLLFHSVLEPGSGVYVNQSSYRLHGPLDAAVFRETWQRVVDRHAILRTAFVWEGLEEPAQVVRQRVRIPWQDEDWRGLSAADREARLDELRAGERFLPFNLAKAPLARFVLVRLSGDEHEFVWTFHHILLDGWSTPLLVREVLTIYAALSTGRSPELPPPSPYRDYIAWLQRQDLAATEAFWRRSLAGFTEPTPLPIGHPAARSGGSAEEEAPVAPDVTAALRALATRHQVTLNTLVLGAWSLLLGRYSGEEDVLFGSVVSGRPVDLPGVEAMVGLFINTLPVRVAVPGEKRLIAWLQEVQKHQVELRQHEHSPLVRIQKWSDLPPGSRLFDTLYVFENYPTSPQGGDDSGSGPAGLQVAGARSVESTGYPLTLAAWVAGELGMRASYDSGRFEPAAIRRLLGHLSSLLAAIASGEDRPLSALPLLTPGEARQIEAWNETRAGWDCERSLHGLIEAQVDLAPEAVAVSFAGATLTCRELDERANRLAHRLIALGCGPEQRAALFLERSTELIVALLAVLKSGAAYLPLDPDHPAERIAFQAADGTPAVVLTQAHLAGRLPAVEAPVLVLTPSGEEVAAESARRPAVRVDPHHPAYVLYTSGSTGRPKGVAVPHRAIVNRLLWMQDAYRLTADDRVLQKTPYSFDVSVWEFFWPLLAGARLVVATPGVHGDSARLVRTIREEGVTVMHFVPSMLRPFLEEPGVEACRCLRDVMASGEALPPELVERFFARLGARLHNLYGPTEAAVDVTFWACEPGPDRSVPIGRPIANTRIHLLDRDSYPVPVGVPGELYIGGVNLARGYFARPGLTAERFVPAPGGERLYRTGDLARYREDGAIEYLGRTDHQVKVRGVRIELGEIEATLLAHPGVREAAVTAQQRPDGHRRLVAYVVGAGSTPGGEELRRFLQERLPESMVPALFVPLERLPLSSSGKLDRRALPEPEAARPELEEAFVPPQGEDEEALAATWAEVLQVERVGRNDNFFALGGDSILSLQVLSKARERGIDLSLQQIFQHPTVRELAARADAGSGPAAPLPRLAPFELLSAEDRARLPESVEDAYPLAMLQTGMLFHGELGTEASTYHNTVSVHVSAPFDLTSLDLALQRLASRHPLLRTSFAFTGFSEPLQLVHRNVRIPLEVYDLRPLSPEEQEAELERWFAGETRRLFDWGQAPLIRFHVHRRDEDRFQLSWSEHHAILDGWSVATMTAELGQDYLALLQHGPEAPQPPTSTSQYRDFVALERQVLADGEARRFWLDLLRDATYLELPRLPGRVPEPPRIVSLPVPLPPETAARAQALATRTGVPLKNVLLAAHARVLGQASGQDDLVFGVVNNGRLEEADAERVFGLYLNTLPYRLRLDAGTWLDLVRQSFEMERAMLPFRRYPLAEIQRLAGGRPLFEVAFTYMNFHVMQGFANTGGETQMQTLGARNHVPTNFPLSIYFEVDPFSAQLLLSLDYDASLLTAGQVEALAGFYQRALDALLERPESRYLEESLLSEAERRQVLVEWNRTETAYPGAGETLHELIAAQAAKTPGAPALAFEGERLTYRELEARANRLARFLARQGVSADSRVGVCLERSFDLLVALYAVLKAGGAYVPLDPTYPADRLAFMAADAQAPVILTTRRGADLLPAGPRLVLLDEESGAWAGESAEALPGRTGPGNLAYVIYTSGSTGTPKGAMNSHRAVVNRLLWMQEAYGLTAADRVLQKTPFSFDVSVWELFWPLLSGACLVIARPDGHREADYLAGLIDREGVSVLHFVPSMLRAFLEEPRAARCASIRQVCASGEALPPDLVHRFFQVLPHARLDNLYGPTEAAVDVTSWACDPAHVGETVPIGRPIANLRIYVLDRSLQPVPAGVPGEVHIGGVGLARGYHARPGLTAERFVPSPWGEGERLYKTGDLGRHRPDGSVEYLGRLDHQVKLRGFRIELGEIEAALRGHPAVRDCAVVLREGAAAEAHLVAYVVAVPEPAAGPEAGEQVDQWRMVFDQTYESGAEDSGFDVSGWVSSYTGLPIPAGEMREWVDATVERILALAPQSVLEIGCGTGLLLSRLAPRCARYWATDLSAVAVERLRGRFGDGVRLFHRAADDFSGLPEQSFDVVVLNSVVQYFPGADYLARVLEGAVRAVRPGGFVFVGDVRSRPLHRTFHASVEVETAPASTPIGAVRQRALARAAEDGELVLDPAFFTALARRLPGVAGARIALKRGRHGNEMTLFRYDVTLVVGEAARPSSYRRLDGSLGDVRETLAAERPEGVLLRGLPNARLVREVRKAELLAQDDNLFLGQLLESLRTDAQASEAAVDPEDLWALARETGYTADVSWTGDGGDGRFDAFLWRGDAPPNRLPPLGPAEEEGADLPWSAFANDPLRARLLAALVPQLRSHLLGRLPDFMVPSAFVLLEQIPLSPNGKLDRAALPAPEPAGPAAPTYVAPRTPVEETLAGIWQDVLRRSRVGIEDNLFEIGGHSLLATQIIVRIREAMQIDLPLRALYAAPTVAGLAVAVIQRQAEMADAALLASLLAQIEQDGAMAEETGR